MAARKYVVTFVKRIYVDLSILAEGALEALARAESLIRDCGALEAADVVGLSGESAEWVVDRIEVEDGATKTVAEVVA